MLYTWDVHSSPRRLHWFVLHQWMHSVNSGSVFCSFRKVSNNITTGSQTLLFCLTRSSIISKARSAFPISLMQWWILPGPKRPWAISKPRPSPSNMLPRGTRTFSKSTSACPAARQKYEQWYRLSIIGTYDNTAYTSI